MRGFKYVFAVLAAVTLIVAGAGFTSAAVRAGSMMGGDGTNGEGRGSAGKNGMGSMGSMMERGGASDMQAMGSFDKDKPFDLQFIDQMTMHHEGAIMSAKSMISDSKRPGLRKLAADIEKSQSGQIKQMQEFRKQWYPGAKQTSGMPPGAMSGMMGGDSMQAMMGASMQDVMGGEMTDTMFLRMMIPHHQMAVDMAEKALKDAEHPELKNLAKTIRDEQTAEIKLMQGYLKDIEKDGGGMGSMMDGGGMSMDTNNK